MDFKDAVAYEAHHCFLYSLVLCGIGKFFDHFGYYDYVILILVGGIIVMSIKDDIESPQVDSIKTELIRLSADVSFFILAAIAVRMICGFDFNAFSNHLGRPSNCGSGLVNEGVTGYSGAIIVLSIYRVLWNMYDLIVKIIGKYF